ncbi:hypothetical protein NKH85_22440 [Mesorhizobium sp. M0924]|uniref:hypothetical protein n=1 Tax=unclassified Mesorhizobium TaxID=325217 RepID=UPI0012DE0F4D|nr:MULTISPECIES: hypothetical protein [unclassified Mesorhizobium]
MSWPIKSKVARSLHETVTRQNCANAYFGAFPFRHYREALMTVVTSKFGMGACLPRRSTRISAEIREATKQ